MTPFRIVSVRLVLPFVVRVLRPKFHSVLAASLILAPLAVAAAAPLEKVDFNYEISPILSDRCYTCHGPDEKSRKAKLRLDTAEGAFAPRDEELPVINPGHPEKSELYRRITATDPDDHMPPPKSNLSLKPHEIELIRRWIAEGAEWKRHWSFIPLTEIHVRIPAVKNASWPKTPIDRFVLARLEREGLSPAPEVGREQLLRRATMDLTGLPPTPAELDAFLADAAPDAYEKVVDRLLASPAYGERMAVDWLDLARYADTHGYQADRYRPMWPWRDWVIKAFNENLPYDKFITWQLAGDLLPHPTQEQRLATAFNRNHMQTEEGGSVAEEFRVAYVCDRVNTFGTTFLGMTLQCARCHDHKYDPITQKEYYQLFSFFNNIDESGQTSYFTDSTPVPTLLLSDAATDQKLADFRQRIAAKESEIESLKQKREAAFVEWLKQPPPDPQIRGLVGEFPFETIDGGKTPNLADDKHPADVFEGPSLGEGRFGKAILLSGENGVSFKGVGVFSRTDSFSISLWVKIPADLRTGVIIHRTKAALDAGSRGYEMLLEDGKVSLALVHMWPYNSLKIQSRAPLPTNQWVHLLMSYDGSSRARGLKLYEDGKEAPVEVIRDHLFKDILYERVDVDLTLGQRFRDHGLKGGEVDEVRVYDRALTALEAAQLAGRSRIAEALAKAAAGNSEKNRDALFEYYLANYDSAYQKELAELTSLRAGQSKTINPVPEIMVMEEMPEPRPAYVLKRGAYDAHGEEVHPGTPSRIMKFGDDLPRNRLGLSEWLLDPANPLTARVAVNRLWQMCFGMGIVSTPEDFGSQGKLPSHPKLLDWLAKEFVASGWDMKATLRLIVTSATYRQSSAAAPELLARDPDNKLLARGPRYRWQAEILRDNALAAAGLLVRTVGGPSVKPYQPEGLWEEKSGAKYQQDHGAALYRRSLYTFWKRTSPPPAMMIFDASERNYCEARRQRTSTPLQPLVLLNDPEFVEASRLIAERMLREGGKTEEERIDYVCRLLISRRPKPAELTVLKGLYEEQLALFQKDIPGAEALLKVGEWKVDGALPPAELAAGTILASSLMNFDESINKR